VFDEFWSDRMLTYRHCPLLRSVCRVCYDSASKFIWRVGVERFWFFSTNGGKCKRS